MKKLLTLVLAATMLSALIPAAFAADVPADEETAAEFVETAETVGAVPETQQETVDNTSSVAETETEALQEGGASPSPTSKGSSDLAETGASVPKITRIVPSANGVKITYSAFDGAAKYMIFTQKIGGGWKKIGESAATSFEHKMNPNNTSYTYTVRAADKNGKFISGYDKAGFAYACLATPTLRGVESVNGGQKVSWNSVDGAAYYMVYVKTGSEWTAINITNTTSFVNKEVESGKKYSYTVRCWDLDKRTGRSFYVRRGVTGLYIATPNITSFSPVSGGLQINWNASAGAPKYALFVKNGGKWKCLTVTDKTYGVHQTPAADSLNSYTVRCVAADGSFCSGYNTKGTKYRYLAPPAFSDIREDGGDTVLSWIPSEYIDAYRIYRKPFNGAWECIGSSDSGSFDDTTAKKDTLYTYTLRGIDNNRALITHFTDTRTYYYNGKPANGKISIGGSYLYFENGKVRQGYVTIDGKTYYYNSKGVLQKNGLVGSSKEGWRYADKDGVVQMKYTGLASNSAGIWYVKNGSLYRDTSEAITWNGTDYIIIRGRAHEVTDEEEETLFRAIKLTNSVAPRSYSKEKRLEIMFDYIKDAYTELNPRLPDYTGMDWPIIYANDMLIDGEGNCLSYAAEFCFIAKAIGYDEVYACHSGGHGWAEIDGLVYDPEWSRHNFDYSYYALSYDDQTDQDYAGAISPGYDWMHIKICAHL